jgi:hypothetical protein
MKTFTTLFLLSIASIGCRAPTMSAANTELRQNLKAVTLSDGVSQSEAETIAASYFAKHVGCGALTGISDGEDRWIVDGRFGNAGVPIKGFFIVKHSGKVKSPIGPSYDDPTEIFP